MTTSVTFWWMTWMIEKKYWRLNKNWGAGSCVWGERLESCQTSPDLLLGIICLSSFFCWKDIMFSFCSSVSISTNISFEAGEERVELVKICKYVLPAGIWALLQRLYVAASGWVQDSVHKEINRSSHQKDDQRCKKKQIKICFSSTDFNALAKALQRLTNWKSIRTCKCLKLQSCVTIFIIFDQS